MEPFPPNSPDNEHGFWIHFPMIFVFAVLFVINACFLYFYFFKPWYYNGRNEKMKKYNRKYLTKWLLYFAFTMFFEIVLIYLIIMEILDTWGWKLYVDKHLEVGNCLIPINYAFGQCWTVLASRRSYIFIDESGSNYTLAVFMAVVIISEPVVLWVAAFLLTHEAVLGMKPNFRFPGRNYVFGIGSIFYFIATIVFSILAVRNVTFNGITPLGFILWMGITEQGVAYLAVVVIWGLLNFFPVIFFGFLIPSLLYVGLGLVILFISSVMTSGFFSAFSIFIIVAVLIQLLALLQVVAYDQRKRPKGKERARSAKPRSIRSNNGSKYRNGGDKVRRISIQSTI